MLSTFSTLRELTTGDYLGAGSWMSPLVRRSNWLYGQVHGWRYPFLQRWNEGIAQPAWVGGTMRRDEHLTLRLGARLALTAGQTARLQYFASNDTWVTLDSDSNTTQGRYFGGFNPVYERSLVGLSPTPKGNHWLFRFIVEGGTGGFALVYRAMLAGTVGFPVWPTLPTFANSPTVHAAADFNALRTAQNYLFECAKQPRIGSICNSGHYSGGGGIRPHFRWSFRYGGANRLIVRLKAMDGTTGEWGSIRLIRPLGGHPGDACWAPWGEGSETVLQALAGTTLDATYAFNLSAQGLTVGEYYGIELRAIAGPTTHVLAIGFGTEPAVTRANNPKQTWAHLEIPTAAQMNTIRADINELFPAGDRPSPLWLEHDLATLQLPNQVQPAGPGHNLSFQGPVGFYLAHRWRWLRYRGAGKIMSLDGRFEHSLSDSTPVAGEAQLFDLDSLAWLTYGSGYYVGVYNVFGEEPTLRQAYEDYDI